MPKIAKEMTALEVRRLKEPGFHAVGGVPGLMLQVTDGDGRSWVLRAMIGGKRRLMGLGGFPGVSLARARETAAMYREQISNGVDPISERQKARTEAKLARAREITFAEAAAQCHRAKSAEFRNPKHSQQWIRTLEQYAFPVMGNIPVASVDLPLVLKVLEPIWQSKTETATRVRQRMESVLTWASVSGFRTGENPARWQGNLSEVLPHAARLKKRTKENHPALPWQSLPTFMADLRSREGMGARALEFAILTAARSGEVRMAEWREFDLQAKTWTIPADRMKAEKAHTVPLSDQAIKVLEAIPRIKDQPLVFPAVRGGTLSNVTLLAVIKRMHEGQVESGKPGYVDPNTSNRRIVPHGFRSSFKDWSRMEQAAIPDEVSELCLAHVNSDATRAAYARDGLMEQRRELLKNWANFCV